MFKGNISLTELKEYTKTPLWYKLKMYRKNGQTSFDLWVEDYPKDGYHGVAELRDFIGA